MPTPTSSTVRISIAARTALRSLAEADQEPMITTLEKAIVAYGKARFLAGVNADYTRLRQDPALWLSEQRERAAWDTTLGDGVED
jgi:hypothetical protein